MSDIFGKSTQFDNEFEKDPSKFGFCSFEDFRKNKDKWTPKKDQIFEVIDNGSQAYKLKVRKYIYFYEHYKCDSLEQVQRHFDGQGLGSNDIVFLPRFITNEHGGNDCEVRVFSKEALKKRMGWK